jgi:hypothetical protein
MKLTREKHLDHMVRVVPIIVLGYAIQGYIIKGMDTPIGGTCLMVLGGLLVSMIIGFITYDVKHTIELQDSQIEIQFFHWKKVIHYQDILTVENTSPQHHFGTITLKTTKGTQRFYFVDKAEKVKELLNKKREVPSEKLAA